MANPSMAIATSLLFVIVFLLLTCLHPTDAQVGVAYGREGNNLPSPKDVVSLCISKRIGAMRIYYPDIETLEALKGSGIKLTLGVGAKEIQPIGSADQSAADQWVQTNVVPYVSSVEIKYIVVGNEVDPSNPQAQYVLPAMQKVHDALSKNGLSDTIKVTTSIGTALVINAYPPSSGEFSDLNYMTPIIRFLRDNGSPLMANIYPYFAHKLEPQKVTLEYALFNMPDEKAVIDSKNKLRYQNVFDALADATYAAIDKAAMGAGAATMKNSDAGVGAEKANYNDISLIVSESGWSSGFGHHPPYDAMLAENGDDATVENAKTYYTNLIRHVNKGTPLKPGKPIETYLFAMFNEEKKGGEMPDSDEHYFGLFNADMQPKYGSLNFGG